MTPMGEVMFVLARVPDEARTRILADAKERSALGCPKVVAHEDAILAEIDREIDAGPPAQPT